MATSNDLIDTLAKTLGMNRSTCANLYKQLRTANLVSNDGRGRHAAAMTARDAATALLAIGGSEHVQDAAGAVTRYASLVAQTGKVANGLIVPSPTWKIATREFPRLGAMPRHHEFLDVLVALIESYIDAAPTAGVTILMQGPYPWAGVTIVIGKRAGGKSTSIWYSDDGDEDGPGELARMDKSKERQRRKFVALGGDLKITSEISDTTLAALGKLLRDQSQ